MTFFEHMLHLYRIARLDWDFCEFVPVECVLMSDSLLFLDVLVEVYLLCGRKATWFELPILLDLPSTVVQFLVA